MAKYVPATFQFKCVLLLLFFAASFISAVHVEAQNDLNPHIVNELGRDPLQSIHWSPDGSKLAVVGEQNIWIYSDELADVTVLRRGHTSLVRDFSWSPDSSKVASASSDGTVRIWDVKTATTLTIFEQHNRDVFQVSWHPEGTLIASGDANGIIKIWNPANGQEQTSIQAHDTDSESGLAFISALLWSKDGTLLLSRGVDGKLVYWDTTAYERQTEFALPIWPLHWDENGELLYGENDQGVVQWNRSAGTLITILEIEPDDRVREVALNHRENKMAILQANRETDETNIWLLELNSLERTMFLSEDEFPQVLSIAWNPAGRYLGTVDSDNRITVWDTQTGEIIDQLEAHHEEITTFAWSKSGQYIASGHKDGEIFIWDRTETRPVTILKGHQRQITALSWGPDDRYLASADAQHPHHNVLVWDMHTHRIHQQLDMVGLDVAWHPTQNLLVTGQVVFDGYSTSWNLVLWDADRWTIRQKFDDVAPGPLSWSPTGNYLATADTVFRLTGSQRLEVMSDDIITSGDRLVWSSDETLIISSGVGNGGPSDALVWNVETESLDEPFGADVVFAWQPDSDLLVRGRQNQLSFMNAYTRQVLLQTDTGYRSSFDLDPGIRFMAWDRTGALLAVVSTNYSMQIWTVNQ